MQAQRERPPSLSDCKDKFLVQSCIVGPGVTEASQDIFESRSATDIKHTKLRVVLLGPPEPPSPVPEGVEEDHSPHGKADNLDTYHSSACCSQVAFCSQFALTNKHSQAVGLLTFTLVGAAPSESTNKLWAGFSTGAGALKHQEQS